MTDKERYKQAFSSLHASGHISLEVNMNHNRKFHPTRKLIAAKCLRRIVVRRAAVPMQRIIS